MKKLEELGISPTPWTFYDEGTRNAEPTYTVRSPIRVISHGLFIEDASFISASPDMYECLREAVIETCHACPECGQHPDYDCNGDGDCFVRKWRAALAKAAGESEA